MGLHRIKNVSQTLHSDKHTHVNLVDRLSSFRRRNRTAWIH